jgi:hypothetical protein
MELPLWHREPNEHINYARTLLGYATSEGQVVGTFESLDQVARVVVAAIRVNEVRDVPDNRRAAFVFGLAECELLNVTAVGAIERMVVFMIGNIYK